MATMVAIPSLKYDAELVTAKVERQRAVQKTQAKELSRLFGAKKASFTLDEWMVVQVEAEEASKGPRRASCFCAKKC